MAKHREHGKLVHSSFPHQGGAQPAHLGSQSMAPGQSDNDADDSMSPTNDYSFGRTS
jgi:hypothetical protein